MATEHPLGHQGYNLVSYGQRASRKALPAGSTEATPRPAPAVTEAVEAEPVASFSSRCVAPPRLDGHTRARYETTPAALQECELVVELQALFGDRLRLRAEKNSRGVIVRELPTGHWAECTVTGTRRHMLTFYVWDRVFISMNTETGEVKVQWKARELWEHGGRQAITQWCAALSRWLDGAVDLEATDLYRMGWVMTGLEICADFVGLEFGREDIAHFMGKFGRDDVAHAHGDGFGNLETIALGSRRSNVSLCIYDKTAQIRDAKDGRNLPTYSATWERHGWDGENVTRVELRLAKRGLEWKAGEHDVNLRDPFFATCSKTLRAVWASLLGNRYRLVMPGSASRERRCKLDPRWSMVVDAAAVERVAKFEQSRRESDDAYAEKLGRASRDATKAILRVAALHGVSRFETRDDLQTATELAIAGAARQGLDLEAYAVAYTRLIRETLGGQVDDARERWDVYAAAHVRRRNPTTVTEA